MSFENILNKVMEKIPYVRYAAIYRMNEKHRPGHYYSPVVNLKELALRKEAVWADKQLTGIDLNEAAQVSFLQEIIKWNAIIPFPEKAYHKYRYHFDNGWFPYADGIVLFAILNHFKPARLIEVGSGFSSALTLDTNEQFLDGSMELTFIDPNPEDRLFALLRGTDKNKCTVVKGIVQDTSVEVFKKLKANDILLIDNSHVSKTGSDVNFIFTEVLPNLEKGVLIHVHDIFFPFEYPQDWLFEHRLNWNELYMMHCFLLYNKAFEIIFFSDYIQTKYRDELQEKIPGFMKSRPGSIWLRKVM
ncbi:class I SAM-dependent methyltransferase [soil metagenome]